MAYVSPSTRTTGDLITSAIWNQDIVSNSQASIPDTFTTAGDIAYATGADALTRLAIGSNGASLEVNTGATAPQWGGLLSGTTARFVVPPIGTAPSSAVVASNNQVKAFAFELPIALTLTSINCYLDTASAGGAGDVGVYTADGNTKLLSLGSTSTTATGAKSKVFTAVTLPRAMYWLAWTFDNTTAAWAGPSMTSAGFGFLNGTTTQIGTAANSASTGVLPTTLGVISAALVVVPYAKLQG